MSRTARGLRRSLGAWLLAASAALAPATAGSLFGLGDPSTATPTLDPSAAQTTQGGPQQQADIEALSAFLKTSVDGMVARGERKSGTGGVNAWLNNKSALGNAFVSDRFPEFKTCYQQTEVTLGELQAAQAQGQWTGWTFEAFDATAPWRKGEGIDHMFVKATSPEGRAYQVDPWYGYVIPFVEPEWEPGVWDWWTRGNGGIINTIEYYQGQ